MIEDGIQRDESFELKGIILPNKSSLTEDELKKLRYGSLLWNIIASRGEIWQKIV